MYRGKYLAKLAQAKANTLQDDPGKSEQRSSEPGLPKTENNNYNAVALESNDADEDLSITAIYDDSSKCLWDDTQLNESILREAETTFPENFPNMEETIDDEQVAVTNLGLNLEVMETIDDEQRSVTDDANVGLNLEVMETIDDEQRSVTDDANVGLNLEVTESIYGNMNEGRIRRKNADRSSWKIIKNKNLRMKGEEYKGYSNGKLFAETKPARQIGPTCVSLSCQKTPKRNCEIFSTEERLSIFNTFWKITDWSQRQVFVCSHVSQTTTKTCQTNNDASRRQSSFFYYLPYKEGRRPVCRKMFLQTLGLGYKTVQSWLKNSNLNMSTSSAYKKHKTTASRKIQEKRFLNQFIEKLPKLPSHYQRSNTSKLFLESNFNSYQQLYNFYVEESNKAALNTLSITKFCEELNNKNISLFQLRKDQCDVCTQFSIGSISQLEYDMHQTNKVQARCEMENDKRLAESGKLILLTMDLQSVKVCPSLQVSSAYYKTKLACHNFTVFDNTTHHATCYWFSEVDSNLVASSFASCLIDYIERHCAARKLPIVIFSDGCTYQNRNAILSNALLQLSKQLGVQITQKYLEKGHTQMECDSIHSAIERKIKGRDIYLPSDYIRYSKEARKNPNPYEVIPLQYNFFKDYSVNTRYKSIRPGRKAGDPTVTDIRALHYDGEKIRYKLNFNDENYKDLPTRPKAIECINPPQLNLSNVPITYQKWMHLQELKPVIPEDCRAFYDSLPYLPK